MARVIWTEPAVADVDALAEYIALDNPSAACRFAERVFASVERLEQFPLSGRRLPEATKSPYREIVALPCRVFYRTEGDAVFILYVMRSERLLCRFLLDERDRTP